jgi:alpha-glucosidase (family GH31 glycosyl hydrolase)
VIQHHPYGIDDPYKRLPTERFPRDPRSDDRVHIGFVCTEARSAWVNLHTATGVQRCEAQALGTGQWLAALGSPGSGAHRYQILADTAQGELSSEVYPLEIGRWCEAATLHDLEATPNGVRFTLRTNDGSSRLQARLSVPIAGVCCFEAGVEVAATEALPVRVAQDGAVTTLHADGLEVRVNLETLMLAGRHPNRADAQFTASLRVRWLELPGGAVTHFEFYWQPTPDEALYGLGERFDQPDKRGREYDVRVYEEYKEQGQRTYLPVPFVVSNRAYGVWLDALEPSVFDLCGETCRVSLEKLPDSATTLRAHFIVAETPYQVTAAFTRLTGAIAVPPKWAFGPWMSSNDWNSQAKTEAVVRRTVQEDVPSTALVLEAWSDEHTFYIFNDAEYAPKAGNQAFKLEDFQFTGRWPDPKAMVNECHAHGIRVLLWQIPVQKRIEGTHAQHDADEEHMLQNSYGIREADGSPYRCRGWWFTDGLVMDFSNPDASRWWFDKRRYLLEDLGIDGMKTDGGEHLWGRDLRAHDGQRGLALYNSYPNTYVGAYHDFVQHHTGGEGLTFSRAGYTGAQRFPGHWAGDENSTWDAFKASIQAGLSAGISGVSMWGWDIGGFSGDIPTVELYLRSTAFACFCPIMQYHSEFNPVTENRDRSPWNISERHNDPRALEVYRRYAKLRMRLLDFVHDQAQSLSAEGLPLLRYPALEHPTHREFLAADVHSVLFTRDLLVCAVVEKGALARTVHLPPGTWVDAWSGARFEGADQFTVAAPLERIPVFIRAEAPQLETLLEAFRAF